MTVLGFGLASAWELTVEFGQEVGSNTRVKYHLPPPLPFSGAILEGVVAPFFFLSGIGNQQEQ